MDREPIYLEKDDEITSVVDKLKASDGVDLDVVIPKDAIMLQSVINLKLLKRQAESLGKEVTIVTQDKVGTKLAQQIGIPVVAKEGQVPKEMNMTESEEPEYTEEDIQMKENEPAVTPVVSEKPAKEDISSDDSGEEPPKKPVGGKKNWFKKHWKGVLIAGGFGLLAILLLAYIYVPLANINIKLAAENKKIDITFKADKDASAVDTDEGVIPAKEIVEEIEKVETSKASGEKDVGEKATGTATIVNHEYSTDSFTLTAGSRIVTSGGLVYKTKTNVTVPKYTKIGATITDGKIDVQVEADQVGEKYNVTGGNMTIPGLMVSGVTAADVYAVGGSFTGGSSRKVKFVTANDIAAAKEAATTAAESELKSKINDSVKDSILLEGALETEEISSISSAAVGKEAEEFSYTVKLKGTALVITENDLKALAEDKFRQEIGDTKEIVEADSLISSTKLTDLDIGKGEFRATLAGEAYIATKIAEEEVKNAINGEAGSNAIEIIKEIEGVEEVEIRFFPKFYNRIPRINSHIYFKTEILKTQLEE